MTMILFLYCAAAPRALHSFPTRRSSDLHRRGGRCRLHVSGPRAHPGTHPAAFELRLRELHVLEGGGIDRKSTRLNSSHVRISYAVFCLKKKTYPPPPATALIQRAGQYQS